MLLAGDRFDGVVDLGFNGVESGREEGALAPHTRRGANNRPIQLEIGQHACTVRFNLIKMFMINVYQLDKLFRTFLKKIKIFFMITNGNKILHSIGYFIGSTWIERL